MPRLSLVALPLLADGAVMLAVAVGERLTRGRAQPGPGLEDGRRMP